MMTLAPIRSAEHAATYFEQGDHADYYLSDESCPSEWVGGGANKLGIAGQRVDAERFCRYLNGDVAGAIIGVHRNGEREHKSGWDLQFSPSKSVSIAALVCGDDRVIAAHEMAVNEALEYLEKSAAYTRLHTRDVSGEDHCEQVATGNLLVAKFRHDTSRSLDPQLHTHAVVVNATLRTDGQWRSLESRHFYALQKEAGLVYRQSLAAALVEMGYSLERTSDANFEIAGIPEELLRSFSQRTEQINQKLLDLGLSREDASSAIKEKLAHEDRNTKKYVDRKQLLQQWTDIAQSHSFSAENFVQTSKDKTVTSNWSLHRSIEREMQLDALVKQVISSLSERDAIFSEDALVSELNKLAVGYGISRSAVNSGVGNAKEKKLLISTRAVKSYSAQHQCWQNLEGFTTPQIVQQEETMLARLKSGHGKFMPAFSPSDIARIIRNADAKSIEDGFGGWSAGYKSVLRGVLSSADQFVSIQGAAGTAKTSTILRTIAQEYKARGYDVMGIAPSVSACESLADGANIGSVKTLAAHLLKYQPDNSVTTNKLWLVDEASLVATKDMSSLLEKAIVENARVVLVGDVKQLGSVEAGAAFQQLQDSGIRNYVMDEIVRQENPMLLDSVCQSIDGDVFNAIRSLENGGGAVIELTGKADDRHRQIVDYYMALDASEREATLLIDPSREGRDQLTQCLRERLKLSGELASNGLRVARLERLDLTHAAAQDPLNYQVGDLVYFSGHYKVHKIDKGSYWEVKSTNANRGTIHLVSVDGREVILNPSVWGAKSQIFRPSSSELSVGDKLIWAVNDRGLGFHNGSRMLVKKIDHSQALAELVLVDGTTRIIDLNSRRSQHWNYDYITTVHAAQGKTCDRVLYHAESYRRNLASQQALYVAISRARQQAIVFTDDKAKLVEQIREHSGQKQNAISPRDLGFSVI
ncbi:MobF family relaxase [Cellvibrio sp. NN19]|uniref:MobF family relaxase n=1 Tax=Cellvibrio chitinivorans TaxID=3102792 RepID=UPI002B410577|nr:MobF family relaxase [Cellvibrio sp. NN19]